MSLGAMHYGSRVIWLGVGLLVACSAAAPGSRVPDARDAPRLSPAREGEPAAELAWARARAVFDARCVVCHGCYDAPCQLKLESAAGIERGASKSPVYDASRFTAAAPTRLGIDARLVSEWRARGFHGVLPPSAPADRTQSLLLSMLELKRAHPLTPEVDVGKTFTLGLDREQTCVEQKDFAGYAKEHPLWGMPYALPGIASQEQSALEDWIRAGAPHPAAATLAPEIVREVELWERFFNEPSPKRRLAARYIYEHLFLASLYFKGLDELHFYRLVRSRTPSGFPVDEIPTRRPFEDPGKGAFYYRFVPREEAKLVKTHMPYALDRARLERYEQLFVKPDFSVAELPSYEPRSASNPFKTFRALPLGSRYRFMLDDAEFSMMNFIKGPVCRGQIALNVIQERFWIAFVDPDAPFSAEQEQLLEASESDLELPASAGSNALPTRWFGYADEHEHYVKKKSELWARNPVTLDLIWNGDAKNDNAALTVFRHFDSASVVKGFVGGPPGTAWVVDYPLFERIHYLLVAGFDVFGNVSHQLMTRMYMDFLRMEGEANFLALLPPARRGMLVDAWYRGLSSNAKQRVRRELAQLGPPSNISYRSEQPERELFSMLEKRVAPVLSHRYAPQQSDPLLTAVAALEGVPGGAASFMPELVFLAVPEAEGGARYFTVMRDSAHTNVAELFNEDDRRVPAEDVLRVVPGFLGAYPNAIFRVERKDVDTFVTAVAALGSHSPDPRKGADTTPDVARTESDYRELRQQFGVLRNARDFWNSSDQLHGAYRAADPLEAGMFDYNRLEAP